MLNGKEDFGERFIGALIFAYTIHVPIDDNEANILLCALNAENKTGTFNVFDYKRDKSLCNENKLCYWTIKDDGLCLYENDRCLIHYDWWK